MDRKTETEQPSLQMFGTSYIILMCAGPQMEHTMNLQHVCEKNVFLSCSSQWCTFNFCVVITFLAVTL